MALLLSVKRLTAGGSGGPERSPSSIALVTTPEGINAEAFGNPTFELDKLPEEDHHRTLSISIQNENNNDNEKSINLKSQNASESYNEKSEQLSDSVTALSPSDSGIHLWLGNDDDSLVETKSVTSVNNDESNHITSNPEGSSYIPSNDEDEKTKKEIIADKPEPLCTLCVQVLIPFLVAGLGTCGAGLLLDAVEKWEVFKEISELFILVPTLLGLKGNLEMTLASRLSTQANLGKLQTLRQQWHAAWGNMALLQCQATVLGFLASCIASVSTATGANGFRPHNAFLLGASALFTASVASFVLGGVTLFVVILSHRLHIDPDNVASPIAASLGDVTTLGILAVFASALFNTLSESSVPSVVVLSVFTASIPFWILLTYRNTSVRPVLYSGWAPILLALLITSAGGYILEFSVSQFKGLAIFQPVINGVAGNLVAVQASRLSTAFHRDGVPGSNPPDGSTLCLPPHRAFFDKGSTHPRTARLLLAFVIPGHLLFGYGIAWAKGGDTALSSATFVPIYLSSALLQVALLLYITKALIHWLWRWGIDPDNAAIPILTALGDFSGMAALTAAFSIHTILFGVS